jgi:alkylated DNA repair protein (DNA oxidative demethylase)
MILNPFTLQSGLVYYAGAFSASEQNELVESLQNGLKTAPLFTPTMPRTGKPFSVRMSNFGRLGWLSDKAGGYRYQATHPDTKQPWPKIPDMVLDLWRAVASETVLPEACLLNHYTQTAKMGLHQDRDEADFSVPVVSISLGDTGVFRFKGTARAGASKSIKLQSGDVLVMGGDSRLCFHGIDRILAGSSTLFENTVIGSGRVNLTLRRVAKS